MAQSPAFLARAVLTFWVVLLILAATFSDGLSQAWPGWSIAFIATAVWGLNVLLIYYGVGPPYSIFRLPFVSVAFAFLMTVVGSGSYWATTQLFPLYRVNIERAILFVALCTLASLIGCIAVLRSSRDPTASKVQYVWDWSRLKAITCGLFVVALLGTYVSIRRIGYIPIVSGDPESLRVEFPAIAGVWYRLSFLGTVVGLLVGVQAAGRRADWRFLSMGLAALVSASLFGNRFFAALPIGVVMLLWNQTRSKLSLRTIGVGLVIGVPILALIGFWRQQDTGVGLLAPATLILYGSLSEFRDVGWTLDYYSSGGHALLHGSTLGGLVVPLLPTPVWAAVGVDKAAIFAHSNASVLAQEMAQVAAQRVGLYGELFMNFGLLGALVGALLYGVWVGYLDRQITSIREANVVRGLVLAIIAAATIYAQVGQWNMFTSTVTSLCYPILLLALIGARRVTRA